MFMDRGEAGGQLARRLLSLKPESPLVLGLPRGGLLVAREVARVLDAPLDVWLVKKIGAPGFEELGVGAVSEGGMVFLDRDMMLEVGVTESHLSERIACNQQEIAQRAAKFRGDSGPPDVTGRTVILVDDGIATGGTARAAIQALRTLRPRRIVLAVPVAATQSLEVLQPLIDDVVCVNATPSLFAIGAWYQDFTQLSDDEVVRILDESRGGAWPSEAPPHAKPATVDPTEVLIPVAGGQLEGTLSVPEDPRSLVLFAHGSGSSRSSPRNRHVASVLVRAGLATLLLDLLTAEEGAQDELTGELRFDIDLLADRLEAATDWIARHPLVAALPIGYFGTSTGAAAALVAAAKRPEIVRAVVSRGGRPDLALAHLREVRAPTRLIVGGRDSHVIAFNERAYGLLGGIADFVIVPGATHLFEEPGALDAVARLAANWFTEQLPSREVRELDPGSGA